MRNLLCNGTEPKYEPLGIIAAHRASVGKLPEILGIHYVDLLNMHERFLKQTSETMDKDCKTDPKLALDVVREYNLNINTGLSRIEKTMEGLPEVRKIVVAY